MVKLIGVFVAVLLALALIINALLTQTPKDGEWYKFGFELLKISAQLILVAIFGGVLVHEYNRKRSKKLALNEFRKTILRDLSRAYSDTKKSRRVLRANCCLLEGSEKSISRADYVEEMQNIIDIQLRFEIIKLDLTMFEKVFTEFDSVTDKYGKEKKQLKILTQLKIMENYLHDNLIDEYERVFSENRNLDPLPISKLPALEEFTKKTVARKKTAFNEIFRAAFKQSLEIIKKESLKI